MKIMFVPLLKTHFNIVDPIIQKINNVEVIIVLPDQFIDASPKEILRNYNKKSIVLLSKTKEKDLKVLFSEQAPDILLVCNDQPVIIKAFIYAAIRANVPILLIQDGVLGFKKLSLIEFIYRRLQYAWKVIQYFKMYIYLIKTAGIRAAFKDFVRRLLIRNVHWIGFSPKINFAVMGNYYAQQYVKQGFPDSNIFVTGTPMFDHLHEFLSRGYENIRDKRYIKLLILSQPLVEYNLWTKKKWMKFIKEITTIALSIPNVQIKIRPHPAESREKYKKLPFINKISLSEGETLLTKDILESDLVITYNSTAIIEAIILKKVILIYNFDKKTLYVPYDKYFPDCIASSFLELKKKLNEMVSDILHNNISSYMVNRDSFISDFVYKVDGNAAVRLAKLISKLVRSL